MTLQDNKIKNPEKGLPLGEDLGGAVLIIGAGLCGSLLALRLAQRGFLVEVFELF